MVSLTPLGIPGCVPRTTGPKVQAPAEWRNHPAR
jgi:hypothetical protein